jgi:hypothetical protein
MAENKLNIPADSSKWEQTARDELAEELEKKVIAPIGLMAGLLAAVKDDVESDGVGLSDVGNLLGLLVHGARKELEVQRQGGFGAYWLSNLLENYEKGKS